MKNIVTLRALTQRVNRKLAHEGQQLKAYRGGRWESDLGRFYLVDIQCNTVEAGDVDPEKLGRELGVLKAWEVVAE